MIDPNNLLFFSLCIGTGADAIAGFLFIILVILEDRQRRRKEALEQNVA